MSTAADLVRAAHPGPTLAVTVVTGLLASGLGHGPASAVTLVLAVLSGQLVIGWSNDLADAERDRRVGRGDKPLATGDVSRQLVVRALAAAAASSVLLSALLGALAAAVHLVLVVGSGLLYNLRLKGTWLSWLPYAVAFGALPAVVALSRPVRDLPAWWVLLGGAMLGVGAHLVNVVPDLDEDRVTGIRGLPHRLGARGAQVAATLLLLTATVVVVAGAGTPPPAGAWAGLALAAVLTVVALVGSGRRPFQAAMAIALVDVVMLAAFA